VRVLALREHGFRAGTRATAPNRGAATNEERQMRHRMCAVLVVLALGTPAAASAQVAWDSPFLMPPRGEPGFGLFLIDAHRGELGALATWRSPSWNFGVRGGIAEEGRGGDDDVSVFGGIDFNGTLTRASEEWPLDVDWVFGAGLGVGDNVLISVPVGLTSGHVFTGEGVVFTPYVTPRVVLDALLGDEGEDDDDLSLDFAFDLGLDLTFSPSFTVRFGATLGDREAVAIGVVF
jgi:hypothetical protein